MMNHQEKDNNHPRNLSLTTVDHLSDLTTLRKIQWPALKLRKRLLKHKESHLKSNDVGH